MKPILLLSFSICCYLSFVVSLKADFLGPAIGGCILISSPENTTEQIKNWQKELDGVARNFTSASKGSQKTIAELQNVLRDADQHQTQMYDSLKEYKDAIDRVAVEIENIRLAAKKVLKHKSALQEATENLLKYQNAGEGQ